MLTYDMIGKDQEAAINAAYENDVTYLVATMGFGKSVVTLSAVADLIADEVVKRVLIVAPLKVCNDVWKTEHLKWEHLKGMDIAHAIGSPAKRKEAIESLAEVVVINIDNFVWFMDNYGKADMFDGLVLDEVSKYKDSSTKLVKKLRNHVKYFKWVLGMTGTPVHESFTGLFAQMLCMDGGKTFGKNKDKFLRKFFYPTDYEERNWEPLEGGERKLIKAMDWCLHVSPDYTHQLPPVHDLVVGFDLPADALLAYKKFARDSVTVVDGVEIVAENAAVLSGKLGQYASGFLYTIDGGYPAPVHTARAHAFGSLLESVDRGVICYWYKAEFAHVKSMLAARGASYMAISDKGAIAKWNNREIDYLLIQPQSAGHGINLAAGGANMIFYSPIWSNDVQKQTIARLWRRGQRLEVRAWTLVANGTVDILKIQRISDKEVYDSLFHEHVKGCAILDTPQKKGSQQ